jgi:hypothetical protein
VHFPGGVVLKQENLFTITTKAYFIQKVSIDQDLRNENVDIGKRGVRIKML